MVTTSASSDVRILRIDPESAGQRLDNVLARELKGVPRSLIYKILRRGEVRVNKGRSKPDYRVRPGDLVRIPPVRVDGPSAGPPPPPKSLLTRLEGSVLHEDSALLVIDKPSGLPVHAGSGVRWGVIEAMRFLRPELARLELVHRLDRDTSGCLLMAKSTAATRDLHQAFRAGQVDKRYMALVRGTWAEARRIDAPLRRFAQRGGERLVEVSSAGKEAATLFKPITRYAQATLMEATLETGRTHQIRAHAAHVGHPLAGDRKYGCEQFNRSMSELGLRRLFLHAHVITVPRPEGDLILHAELDPVLAEGLNRLGWRR